MKTALWATAVVLAVGGGVAYLVFETEIWWWIGSLAVVPIFLLAAQRQERLEEGRGAQSSKGADGGWIDGPWGPP